MSNRFAWGWKLCTLGYSVALVYLGFVGARDMSGSFETETDWHDAVKAHSGPIFCADILGADHHGWRCEANPAQPHVHASLGLSATVRFRLPVIGIGVACGA